MGRKAGARSGYSEGVDQQIIELLADGFTAREIAAKIHFDETTISNRITGLIRQYKAKTKVQMVVIYVREKMIA